MKALDDLLVLVQANYGPHEAEQCALVQMWVRAAFAAGMESSLSPIVIPAPPPAPRPLCSQYAPDWQVADDRCSKDFGHRDDHVSTSGRRWLNRRAAGQTGRRPW